MEKNRITNVMVNKINLDKARENDFANGKAIRITSTESYKKNEKVDDGLQSIFFGSDFSDETSFVERYSCKCGKYIGMMHANKLCSDCGTRVNWIDTDLKKFGYIIMDHYKTFSPIMAVKLMEALGTFEGEKVLNRIIEVGFNDELTNPMVFEKDNEIRKKHPFIKKGMRWLVENIHEVLDYYQPRKPNKAKLFNEIRNDIDKMFTNSIVVQSSILRMEAPGEKDKKIFKLKINTIYLALIRATNCINDFGPPEDLDAESENIIDRYLFQVYKEVVNLFNEIFNILDGKKGVIASRVIAGRYNFSSRIIISASSGYLRSDEVEMSYIAFMELFRYEIINKYCKIYKCTIIEAQEAWSKALKHYDPSMYAIMTYLCEHNRADICIVVNRNPSLYKSVLLLRKNTLSLS